ncbi:MAG TPA: hypothetical protein VKQ30_20940 [Ktedonobacterales bacterium]|nr:hypothetical protein [Ktedonobacterales bacterium]
MGSKSKAPPAPDYTPIAQASEQAAQIQAQTAAEQLNWAQQEAAMNTQQNQAVLNFDQGVANQELGMQQKTMQWAAQDRQNYNQNFAPIAKEYAAKAKGWDSPGRERAMAGEAAGTVANQFAGAKQANIDQLESYGIDPSQTRYAALNLGTNLSEAAATGAAANNARMQTQLQGEQLLGNAVAAGQGQQQQAVNDVGASNSSGNSAASNTNQTLNNSLATTASIGSTEGTAPQWSSLSNASLGTWGNALNMGYQDQLAGFQANQQASSGVGALIGATAGMGLGAFYGGGNSIFNGIKSALPGFEAGGAVPMFAAGGAIPDSQGAIPLDGRAGASAVPPAASPSGGRAVDDVTARLNVGEFIVPKDVASWEGEKNLQKLVQKARSERQAAAQPGAPQQSAIPVPPQGAPQGMPRGMPPHPAMQRPAGSIHALPV